MVITMNMILADYEKYDNGDNDDNDDNDDYGDDDDNDDYGENCLKELMRVLSLELTVRRLL